MDQGILEQEQRFLLISGYQVSVDFTHLLGWAARPQSVLIGKFAGGEDRYIE